MALCDFDFSQEPGIGSELYCSNSCIPRTEIIFLVMGQVWFRCSKGLGPLCTGCMRSIRG